ncbi:YicC/YloC family endoribonuclease [Parasediminibacterium sp. JCM 36343]|uniref:YicC/YloC family endoribonuclease n=1 Tax=Parasediminibacterium sp. JCM 36343 TaxID=3374279 RepID=UPI00397BA1F6
MLYSMTGYGRSEQTIGDKIFLIELRSLNGKQFDIRMQLPALLKPYEFDIRTMLNEGLERGSVECFITIKQNGVSKPISINADLLKAYYVSVMQIADELQADTQQLLAAILRMPEIMVNSTEILNEKEWEQFKIVLKAAIADLIVHRLDEGKSIEADMLIRVANIEAQSTAIVALEPNRRQKIKENFEKLLEEKVGKENYDSNRLEQELIYYIEKIDISEEQVRLKNHISYFKTILEEKDKSKGKKLSFLLQEFGREINTTGAKAYDSQIQKCVVLMKDELEKAKEQVLNVL